MISTLEKEITFRFLKARKKDGFLNVISIFSFIGIGLGVAVLIIGSKSDGSLYEFKEVDGETQKLKVEDIASQIIKAKQN